MRAVRSHAESSRGREGHGKPCKRLAYVVDAGEKGPALRASLPTRPVGREQRPKHGYPGPSTLSSGPIVR